MLENFRQWYLQYQCEITWWVIGWLSYATIDCLANGNYIFALIDGALVFFNYYMWKQYVR